MLEKIYLKFINRAKKAGYSEDELVLGYGNENAEIMLIGEAPGKDEVLKKQPFVGKAGRNLDEFLEYTGIKREELFITNTVKMRPYKISAQGRRSNRPPNAKERELCIELLHEEIADIKPKIVVSLGNTALKALAGKDAAIGELHGKCLRMGAYSLFALYHPASIIYRRELVDVYKEDLLKLKSFLSTF